MGAQRRAGEVTPFGPTPELGWAATEAMRIDQRYQRSIETRRGRRLIAAIAEAFSWFLCGTLLVVREIDGTLLIIDGQHRWEGAKLRRIPELPCAIFPSIPLALQARAFVDANRLRVAVSPFAIYHASLAAGDAAAQALAEVCAESGVAVPRAPGAAQHLKPGETLALGALKSLVRERGAKVAVRALSTLRQALPEPGALRAHYINALGNLVGARADIDLARLQAAIAAEGIDALEHAVLDHCLKFGTTRITAAETLFLKLLNLPPLQAPAGGAVLPEPPPHASPRTTARPALAKPVAQRPVAQRPVAPRPAAGSRKGGMEAPAPKSASPGSPSSGSPSSGLGASGAASVHASTTAGGDVFTKPLSRRCACGRIFEARRASEVNCPRCDAPPPARGGA